MFFLFRCPAEFIFVFRELGGNLWIRDGRGQTASELADNSGAPALPHLKHFQGEAHIIHLLSLLLLPLPVIENPFLSFKYKLANIYTSAEYQKTKFSTPRACFTIPWNTKIPTPEY